MPARLRARLTYANVMATVAVFLALGGGAYAAATIGAKDIRPNAVRSKHIKQGQVRTGDLRGGAVSTGKLKGGAVTSDRLADGAVTNSKIADLSVTGTKLGLDAVTSGRVSDGSLTGVDVGNRSLTTDDYGRAAGTSSVDLGSINARSCGSSEFINVPAGTSNDPVVVTPSDSWVGVQTQMTYNTRLVGGVFNAFRIQLCNVTDGAVNPPAVTFHWTVLQQP